MVLRLSHAVDKLGYAIAIIIGASSFHLVQRREDAGSGAVLFASMLPYRKAP